MITRENYHQRHDYVSKSALDVVNKSPYNYWFQYLSGQIRKTTDALILGQFFHYYMLEPHLLEGIYFMPEEKLDLRKNVDKEKLKEQENKIYIPPDDVAIVRNMKEAILKIPTCAYLLDKSWCEAEKILTTKCVETEQMLKCRLDAYNTYYKCIIDLKTTESANPSDFMRSVAKYRYHVQNALYADIAMANGLEVGNFYFIAVEKTPPFNVSIFTLDDEAIQIGREEYKKNLSTLAICNKEKYYPNYTNNKITTLSLPNWYGK